MQILAILAIGITIIGQSHGSPPGDVTSQAVADIDGATISILSWHEIANTPFGRQSPAIEDQSTGRQHRSSYGVNWGCTKEPGPVPFDCPTALSQWNQAIFGGEAGTVIIPADKCYSIRYGTCETLACAPRGKAKVESSLIAARLMNPCQVNCCVNARGCWWADGNEENLTFKVGILSSAVNYGMTSEQYMLLPPRNETDAGEPAGEKPEEGEPGDDDAGEKTEPDRQIASSGKRLHKHPASV